MADRGAIVAEPGGAVEVVDDLHVDEPRAGEALVELSAAGVCGSDLSLRDGKLVNPMPLLLGHEATGRVVALGPGTPGPAVGTRVTLWMRPPCRSCRMCLRGEGGLCLTSGAMSATGALVDGRTAVARRGAPVHRALGVGAFATRLVMPVAGLVPVPDAVPDDVAALLGCGVATGAGALLNVAPPAPPHRGVLVIGAGGVGLAAAMTAAALGAGAVVVADPAEHRRAAALDVGATHAIPGGDRRAVRAQLTEALGDTWVDLAIDAVGRAALVDLGFRTVRQGGTVVAVGIDAGDVRLDLPLAHLTTQHKRVLGCFMGGVDPQRDLPRLFALYERGVLPVDRLVGRHRPLAEVAEALDDLAAARGLRTIIDVQA